MDGEVVSLGGGKQQALLALLLLHRNQVVATDRLVDELWDGTPPPTAAKIVQNAVSQLRRALGGDRLVTRGRAYSLRVEPGELDLDRFREGLDSGRVAAAAGDPATAASALEAALELWRGPALADFVYESFAQEWIAQLEEMRLSGEMERIDAQIELGRHAEEIGALEALVARHPLQERLRGQLMLALYRSGRPAEAVQIYQDTRHALVEELGIEPGPALQHLERAILVHDPALVGPERPRASVARLRRRTRWPWIAAVGAAVLVGAAAVGAALLDGHHSLKPITTVPSDAVGVIDPRTNRLIRAIPVGLAPTRITEGDNAIWTMNAGSGTLSRIDTKTTDVTQVAATAAGSSEGLAAIAFGNGAAWVVNGTSGTLVQIDPLLNRLANVTQFEASGDDFPDLSVGDGFAWIASPTAPRVTVVDTRHSPFPVVARIRTRLLPLSIAYGDNSVWFTSAPPDARHGSVSRIDIADRKVTTIVQLPGVPTALTIAYGAVWVAIGGENTVWRIDPQSGSTERTIAVGDGPLRLAAGAGAIWVVNAIGHTISRIDPRTNRVSATIPAGGSPRDVVVADGRVWFTVL